MKKFWLLFLLCTACLHSEEKTVFLTSIIRDQAHVLPRYLKNIENLDYDKKLITVHFYTYNNDDRTSQLLQDWAGQNKNRYRDIAVETLQYSDIPLLPNYKKKEWIYEENSVVQELINKGLSKGKESDYYFFLAPTSLIAPFTLKELIAKDKPIIAPLLVSIPECDDHFANFFYKTTEDGYYAHDDNYTKILYRWDPGVFQVPLVYNAYLIKREYLDKLSFGEESSDLYFVAFARNARKNGVEQYLTNEKNYGVQIHFTSSVTREEEIRKLKNLLLLP